MSNIISSIVALILSATLVSVAVAAETRNVGFYYASEEEKQVLNEHLAKLVDISLAKDPSGNTRIDQKNCSDKGGCATPRWYLQMFREMDLKAADKLKSVADVPAFLRRLVKEPARPGNYWSSFGKPDGRGGWTPVLRGFKREFHQGENSWVDPDTKEVILLEDCANPTPGPAPLQITIIGGTPACVEIHFTTKPGDSVVRFALLGPADVKDDCVAVKRAGESDFERWWADKCPDEHCGFIAAVQVIGQSVRIKGSYTLTPGEHILRLPAFVAEKDSRYVTALCLDRGTTVWPEMPSGVYTQAQVDQYKGQRDQWIVGHSDGIGIRWFEYLNTATETKVSTIWYTQAEGPKNAPYWPPSGEYEKLQRAR